MAPSFRHPTYEPEPAKRNTITDEGMAVVRSAQKKGWMTEFPDRENPHDFDEQ
jgi:hypothetical protein